MDQEKIGQFIKNIRKENNLTQDLFAKKLGVTYQAVSKWENGKSIPDIATLKLISQVFNVNIEELIEGEKKVSKSKLVYLVLGISILIVILIIGIIFLLNKNEQGFEFKTISTTCKDFTINGSAAYNKDKTSIYISNVNYCGKENNKIYDQIDCSLYENYNETTTLISKCDHKAKGVTLEKFLENVKINVDNYSSTCKHFKDSYLYLEINAIYEGENTTYKIPITLEDNC